LFEFPDVLSQAQTKSGMLHFAFRLLALTFNLVNRLTQLPNQTPPRSSQPPEMMIGIVQVVK
jgi:hypothetical protein